MKLTIDAPEELAAFLRRPDSFQFVLVDWRLVDGNPLRVVFARTLDWLDQYQTF